MTIHVALNHVTHYRFDRLVGLSPHLVRLRPAPHCRSPIVSYSMRVEPAKHFVNWQQDPQANHVARLVFPERVRELRVEVDLVAEMSVYNPFDFFLEPQAEEFPFKYPDWQARELAPFLNREPATPRFSDYLKEWSRQERRTVDFLVALNGRLARDVRYLIRMEPGVQTPEETLEAASGSCRDSAWLLTQLLRHLGLAARFVSGYLIQLVPDVKSLDGPSGPAADFTDLHAWCEVYVPGAGWIGLDPTSGLLAGEGHIPLACTPEPSSAAPVTGLVDECETEFSHAMSVARVLESPRVTQPYREDQWAEIVALGRRVDLDLATGDVRLTMGGEPTFVAVDDRDAPEWNTEALGPTKRRYGAQVLARMKARYAPGGFLHFGQGKWYPGEQLPRWALAAYWRADGEPCWTDTALFADESAPGGHGAAEAKLFIERLARALYLDTSCIMPGARRCLVLPVARAQAARQRGPVRFAPRRRNGARPPAARVRAGTRQHRRLRAACSCATNPSDGPRWRTGPWFLRDERLYLMPGDSPLGYRLPLDSLPWVAPTEYPWLIEQDPFAARPPLPEHRSHSPPGTATVPPLACGQRPGSRSRTARARDGRALPARFESAHWIARTALCVEPRGGVLYVFLPPLAALEDYLALLAAVEETAAALGAARGARRLCAALRPAPAAASRSRPIPACSRSMSARPTAGTSWWRRAPFSTRSRTRHGSRRRNSCSTAVTPAPAAATTSCWAAPRRPTARSCGGRISSRACSRTGTTIPPSRTCSRDSSWVPPASTRAWMKRATISSTSWRSRSGSCRRRAARPCRGSPIASSAICSSM